jgi:chromosome segregation ATPase
LTFFSPFSFLIFFLDANITLDTTILENQGLLDSIERMSLDMSANKKRGTALVSLKDEAKALANESRAVREEAGRLEETNKQLQSRFNTIQADATKLAREKAALQNEVDALRRQLEVVEKNSQANENSAKGGNDNLQRRIQRLEEELDEEREVNQKRVADTPQFIQMKKMMQTQSQKIRDLR